MLTRRRITSLLTLLLALWPVALAAPAGARPDALTAGPAAQCSAGPTDAIAAARRASSITPENWPPPYQCYPLVSDLYATMQALQTQYPNLVQVTDYGDSWDKQELGGPPGYDLYVMRLTNQAIAGPKPRFFADGGIHARELATSELVMGYANYLLSNYGTNPDVTALLDYSEIYLVPMTNPDGRHLNETDPSFSLWWRKNTNSSNGCTIANSYGVDLNRNHAFKWGLPGGSGYSCDETYWGSAPASEPETFYYEALVTSLFPDQRGPADTDPAPITTTGFLLQYHSAAAYVLYPWGWTNTNAPNYTDLRAIGLRYRAFTNYTVTNAMYAVSGNTRDWGYGVLGIPSYVVELEGEFYEPCASLPTVISHNLPALYKWSKLADMPYLRIHGPETNDGVQVTVNGMLATITATVTFAWTGNPNSQNVGAAELYVDTPPVRGGAPIAMVPVDGSFNSPTEVARVTIDVGGLTTGRHMVFVRGRGANAYQGYATWGPVTAAFLDVSQTYAYRVYTPLHYLNGAGQ